MSVKLTRIWFAFILLNFVEEALSIKKGYYTIVAPGTVRPHSTFHVSITVNDFHKSCWFNISLTSYPERNTFYGLESIEVKPGTTKLVEFHAPSRISTEHYGNLEVFGYRGIISEGSQLIYFETEKYWVFIQTNKAQYKPGELVKFRVISIDQLTRPAKFDESITVKIYDYHQNLLRTILDVKFVQGVFRSEFQLSQLPVLGVWTINVLEGDRSLAVKNFQVDRYVLPKFNVKIYTKKVSVYHEQMVFEIIASYFHGQPVKGNLSLTVTNVYAPYPQVIPTLTSASKIFGKISIGFNLKKHLHLKPQNRSELPSNRYFVPKPLETLYKFDIEAIVTDDLSEEQSRTALEVEVYKDPYRIYLQAPKIFNSDALLNIKVTVLMSDLDDNSIQDIETPIEIIVGCNEVIGDYNLNNFDKVRMEYKPQIGKDFAIVQVTNKNYSECFLYAEYKTSRSPIEWMTKKLTLIEMDVLTEIPQEGQGLEIKITSPEPIEEFAYEIVSRGDILKSGHVNVPGNETTYILRIIVTFTMIPKITIYVHLIKNMSFFGRLKDVPIKKAHTNSIEIKTDNETKPGQSVYLNVTTDEGSYVGLMGLDRSALHNLQKKDILNEDFVNMQLASVNSIHFYNLRDFNGRTGDIITFSNVFPPKKGGTGGVAYGGIAPPFRIRKLFPESWLFEDFESTPAVGLNILRTAPDSITTWAITGFSIHPDTGLTFTKNTTNLRVFQRFFVSMDLPSLVKIGEIVEVPIYISNYMDQDALTNVTIETESKDLEILDHPEGISKPNQNFSKLIPANKAEKLVFFMKPHKAGYYNVTVQAISSLASDAVQKTLNIQPQGIPYAMSKSYLVHLPEEGTQEDEISIDIPKDAVEGSQRVEVSVVGDIFGPLMRNLQKMARVPYGNGEENMRLIISNSIVLKYLKVLNYSNPSMESKIRRNIELGYQNQLSFKFLDGSFGLFDRKTQTTGDIWQTAFSLWGLEQANEFVRVDPDIIGRGLEYLKSKQQQNGCIKSGIDIEEDVKFTALGLMVFLMDENSSTAYNEVVRKGLAYLNEKTDELEYSPIFVMSIYALILGKHEKARERLQKLTSISRLTSKQMLWTKSDTLQAHLDAIAESLINLFESHEIPEQSLLEIVRGLVISKKEESSVNHVIALHAMISFAEKLSLSRRNLNIVIKDDQGKSGKFRVNAENSQVFQTFGISESSRKISIQSNGHGFAVVDVRYNYNLVPKNQSSSVYGISISTKRISKYLGVLELCSSVPENSTQHKLTAMEVSLQSGFIFTEKDYEEIENLSENIKSSKTNDNRDKIVVYFEFIDNKACMELTVRKSCQVLNSKPGWVIVYGAHDKGQKATKSFVFKDF